MLVLIVSGVRSPLSSPIPYQPSRPSSLPTYRIPIGILPFPLASPLSIIAKKVGAGRERPPFFYPVFALRSVGRSPLALTVRSLLC